MHWIQHLKLFITSNADLVLYVPIMHCLSFGVGWFVSLGYFLVVGEFFLNLIFKLFGAKTMYTYNRTCQGDETFFSF